MGIFSYAWYCCLLSVSDSRFINLLNIGLLSILVLMKLYFGYTNITVDLLFDDSLRLLFKSAQVPFHTCYLTLWKVLPVSALLHAATMLLQVSSLCRFAPLFQHSPFSLAMCYYWGITAILVQVVDFQNDIKRIVAVYL